MGSIKDEVIMALTNLREEKPLVHCITNFVTVNDCANILLAIGGSPIMATAMEEINDVARQASALVINLGTISYEMVEVMIGAGRAANKMGIPVVLDPVGVSFTAFRKSVAFKLLKKVKFSTIRGNVSEIKALCDIKSISIGVDTNDMITEKEAKELILKLSKKYKTIVCMTGGTDYITDGNKIIGISNGNKMLTKVSGTGCMATCLIGAFLGCNDDYLIGTVAAIVSIGIAGEIALDNLKENEGTGMYKVRIIDSASNLKASEIQERGQIYEYN